MLAFPLALVALAAAPLCAATFPHPHAPHPRSQKRSSSSNVIVALFEYSWDSVATECTEWLGPQGFGYAQISPPQESIQGKAWYTDYQPISYNLVSKRGNREQFESMVKTCAEAGVQIIVDAVLNHMASSGSGTGTGGSSYSEYDYPAVPFTSDDFHWPVCDIDWYNATSVYDCQLSNLQDLKSESTTVQVAQAAYLNDLLGLGVAGFRLDAAKSMRPENIQSIIDRLDSKPLLAQEVNSDSTQPVTPNMYSSIGGVLEFRAHYSLVSAFVKGNGIKSLLSWPDSSWVDSSSAVVFVANHDTERTDGTTLNWASSNNAYALASVFLLAQPYGQPTIHSGYNFTSFGTGAPLDSDDNALPVTCFSDNWRCEQRWDAISGMVKFHNAVGDSAVTNSLATSTNRSSFGRGSIGHVAINFESSSWDATLDTDVADGTYCEITSGCASKITVSGGSFTVTIPAYGSVAFYTGSTSATTTTSVSTGSTSTSSSSAASSTAGTVSVTFKETASTVQGENIFVVGSVSALGSWTAGVALTRPDNGQETAVWSGTIKLPASSTIEYKFVKVDYSTGDVESWESGSNRVIKTGSSGSQTVTATWQ
ncbi:glycoside hydrolase superfamily [Leucosporidium creatinivorum]|uniref:Alpha-amylase n=1 Tax=Leucosporidium creatinivorum TaxID=106004 RepID=A0A1Y2G021_9BASI|nr:glycoside hydrolase superfamily [Leucosporidium creatinivorum]